MRKTRGNENLVKVQRKKYQKENLKTKIIKQVKKKEKEGKEDADKKKKKLEYCREKKYERRKIHKLQ